MAVAEPAHWARGLAFWLAVCALLACDDDETALVVVIDTNYRIPDELGFVRARVTDLDGEVSSRHDFEVEHARELPLWLRLPESAGGAQKAVEVELEAFDSGGERSLSSRRAVTGFVAGEVLALPMFLARHCSWTPPCGVNQTCTERARCESASVEPSTLASWRGADALEPLPFDSAACGAACEEPSCGNGDGADPGEVCDDGNRLYGDGCRGDCAGLELCGDGILDQLADPPEECDDGNAVTERCDYGMRECVVCNAACKSVKGETEVCGDGRVSAGELCDDGNTEDGDGCRFDCMSELRCGDDVVDADAPLSEVCDDGNTEDCDACRSDCRAIGGCGDGIVCPGELCEPEHDPGCRSDCMGPRGCGDGFLDADLGEQCDDGNRRTEACIYGETSCVVCDAECRQVAGLTSFCGDGVLDEGERCDFRVSSDCRADCTRCGDGVVDQGEDCDEAGAYTAACSNLCNRPLFFDDMDGPDPGWTQEKLSGNVDVEPWRWVSGQRRRSGQLSRHSGSQPGSDSEGEVRLTSPPIDVSEHGMVRVRFAHHHDFDTCAAGAIADLDGGLVEVALDGSFQQVAPVANDADVLGSCGPSEGAVAFTGTLEGDELAIVELDVDTTGADSLQVAFRVRWDCQGALTCGTRPEPQGWYVDDVAVAPLP